MMHSSTTVGSMPARRTASATTSAPSCGAVKSFNAPRNFPVGVRTALTMTDSTMIGFRVLGSGCGVRFLVLGSGFSVLGSVFAHHDAVDGVLAEQRLQPHQNEARR